VADILKQSTSSDSLLSVFSSCDVYISSRAFRGHNDVKECPSTLKQEACTSWNGTDPCWKHLKYRIFAVRSLRFYRCFP